MMTLFNYWHDIRNAFASYLTYLLGMSGGMKDTTTSKGMAYHVKQFLEYANMESSEEAQFFFYRNTNWVHYKINREEQWIILITCYL